MSAKRTASLDLVLNAVWLGGMLEAAQIAAKSGERGVAKEIMRAASSRGRETICREPQGAEMPGQQSALT